MVFSRANNHSGPDREELEDGAVHLWHVASGRSVYALPQLKAQDDDYWPHPCPGHQPGWAPAGHLRAGDA